MLHMVHKKTPLLKDKDKSTTNFSRPRQDLQDHSSMTSPTVFGTREQ